MQQFLLKKEKKRKKKATSLCVLGVTFPVWKAPPYKQPEGEKERAEES